MDRNSVKTVVRTVLILLARIARRTRTQADDMMVAILQANEERLVEAVVAILGHPTQPPTEEQVVEALQRVGIQV